MIQQKPFGEYAYTAFRFGESSDSVQWVKNVLMRGGSPSIAQIELSGGQEFLIRTFDPEHWSYNELFISAHEESPLGLYVMTQLPATKLGVESLVTRMMNESLAAGFSVHLIAEVRSGGGIAGYYSLLANIADNT